MINIFIGYDNNEIVAYHTLCQSIIHNSSVPVNFCPINLKNLEIIYNRERNSLESTEFSFSRFLVPYLSNYTGWSIFMDCDVIVDDDINNLWALRNDKFSVMCVKHNYSPKESSKFLGQVQTQYKKKNWSSVMLFNNSKCKILSPEVVEKESGLFLHQFKWLESDDEIGELPLEWNFLVGEYPKQKNSPSLLHYTKGGPYFEDYKESDYAEVWFKYNQLSQHVK